LNAEVKAELGALPADFRASFERIVELVRAFGLEQVHEPHIKHIDGQLWEMRLRGRSGIARALRYRVRPARGDPAGLHEENAEDAAPGNRTGAQASAGGDM